MSNTILLSEKFERAAYGLANAMEHFQPRLDEPVAAFCRAIDKMVRIAGMQAANDERKHRGESMAYTEEDFQNA